MTKKVAAVLCALICSLALVFAMGGCGKTDEPAAGAEPMWQYEYAGVEHPYLEAVSDYLVDYNAKHLEAADGMIPCITSVEIDNEDSSAIRMWGIFDIYNYSLKDKTLVEENGKRLIGMFSLKQEEDGGPCTVNEATFADEGDAAAIEKMCEGHEMALAGLSNPVVTKETRRWYISQFVEKAGLDATQYQTADGETVPLAYETEPSPDWVAQLPEAGETNSLIIVDITIGSNAVLTMHEKNAQGDWEQTLDEAAFIGKNGPGKTKEGDLKTPLGTFGFNKALGILDDPGCAFEYTKVNDSHYWDADSSSDRYNTLVSTDEYTDFDKDESEHIVDYPNAYKYILNTTYNEEGTPNKGSAIFLHCYREQRTYTGGCISIPLEKMEYVMKNVEKDTKIIIRMQEAAAETADADAEETDDADAPEALPESAKYGYAGDDPTEAAAYIYMAEKVSRNFDKADVSIPTVMIVATDYTNEDDVLVYGDFWVDNYNIEGDTLKCVSGGNFPGVMHLSKDGDGYIVSKMDLVEDGGGFDASAKELFGDYYDDFMNVYSDDEGRAELRKITVSDFVNLNGLSVTRFQDEGWDPVELYK